MQLFDNWKISRKVPFAFGLVFAVTLGLGGLAIERLSRINTAAADIRQTWLPGTRILGQLAYETTRFRQYEATFVLAADADGRAGELKLLNATRDRAEQAFRTYESTIAPGAERRLADDMTRLWADYLEMDTRFQALTRDQGSSAAGAFMRGDMRATFNRFQTALQADVELTANEGTKAADLGANLGRSAEMWVLIGLGLAGALCVAAGLIMIRTIATPIAAMTTAMGRLAGRDTTVAIPGAGRGDEIGAIAKALAVFKENMIESDRVAAQQEAERAVKEERSAKLARLVRSFETQVGGMVGLLSSASTELEATAQSMTATAGQTSSRASSATAAAEEASAGVQTVAASAEELTVSIQEISRQVARSAQMTGKAVVDARRTNEIVHALADSAQRIGQVVDLITSIAGQTNLLALNATIEAARAGDAGKGFAVVASEVKGLASQTARATEEIAGQIGQIQASTREAVEAIRDISGTIEEVSGIATSIASAVEEQGAATAEIARNVQQTSASTQDVTSNIAGVSQGAESTGAAASQLLSAAGELSQQAERLTAEVDSFVAGVRAA